VGRKNEPFARHTHDSEQFGTWCINQLEPNQSTHPDLSEGGFRDWPPTRAWSELFSLFILLQGTWDTAGPGRPRQQSSSRQDGAGLQGSSVACASPPISPPLPSLDRSTRTRTMKKKGKKKFEHLSLAASPALPCASTCCHIARRLPALRRPPFTSAPPSSIRIQEGHACHDPPDAPCDTRSMPPARAHDARTTAATCKQRRGDTHRLDHEPERACHAPQAR
jgi:hypothetical protein